MRDIYTTIVIGSGPAGLFASAELHKKGIKSLLLERGKTIPRRRCPMTEECYHCKSCHEIEGIGGAGGYSDGKLCNGRVGITEDIIGNDYETEVGRVNDFFRQILGDDYKGSTDQTQFCSIDEQSCEEVTEVVPLGTSTVRQAFDKIFNMLSIDKIFDARIVDASFSDGSFKVIAKNGKIFLSKYVLVATGNATFIYAQI